MYYYCLWHGEVKFLSRHKQNLKVFKWPSYNKKLRKAIAYTYKMNYVYDTTFHL